MFEGFSFSAPKSVIERASEKPRPTLVTQRRSSARLTYRQSKTATRLADHTFTTTYLRSYIIMLFTIYTLFLFYFIHFNIVKLYLYHNMMNICTFSCMYHLFNYALLIKNNNNIYLIIIAVRRHNKKCYDDDVSTYTIIIIIIMTMIWR